MTEIQSKFKQIENEIYPIAAKLAELREQCSQMKCHSVAGEFQNAIRSIAIAAQILRIYNENKSLPAVEDVQKLFSKTS